MPSFASCSLSLALLVAGYFNALCITAPNSTSTPYRTDRIRFLTGKLATILSYIASLAVLYQALIILFFTTDDNRDTITVDRICPHPDHLRTDRFVWNERTIGYLVLLAVGAWIRLSAYDRLGRNFTFQLAPPDRLVTTGVYRLLQHPSYTGLSLVLVAYLGLIVNRWDTALACLIPGPGIELLRQWEGVLGVAGALVGLAMLRIRVGDEERMLRERFGKDWEKWHRATARLVPGIF